MPLQNSFAGGDGQAENNSPKLYLKNTGNWEKTWMKNIGETILVNKRKQEKCSL
jgi:hypothetical protein